MSTTFFSKDVQQQWDNYRSGTLNLSPTIVLGSKAISPLEKLAKKHNVWFYEASAQPRLIIVGYLPELSVQEQHVPLSKFYKDLSVQFSSAGFFAKYGQGTVDSCVNYTIYVKVTNLCARPMLNDGITTDLLDFFKSNKRHIEFNSKESLQYELKNAWDALRNSVLTGSSQLECVGLRERLEALIETDDQFSLERIQEFLKSDSARYAVQVMKFTSIAHGFIQRMAKEQKIPYVVMLLRRK